ncbi:MAG: cysteine desulfurase [Armatimonadetes bacterium]|nr:cysteine desulfurase [Armatimonadota bacterium]
MIYLDHAATTPVRPEVRAAMEPLLTDRFGNPSSVHTIGQQARALLDGARDTVARCLGARAEEIVFTSGGTEADNLALIGSFLARRAEGKHHLITVQTEHHAILESAEFLEELEAEVTLLPVDGSGRVDPEAVRAAIRPETFLVSVMAANNEIGTVAPLAEIAAVCREAEVPLHTDAVQGMGLLEMRVDAPYVDLLSLSAHKIYGPKGVGALYVRRGTPLKPILHGGSQERRRRGGTENIVGIVALARALELAVAERQTEAARQTALRDHLIVAIEGSVPGAVLNGDRVHRLPNNVNFSFPGLESDTLLLGLDLEGVCASSGSACAAGAVEPSHVIQAISENHARGISAVRLTVGHSTTEAEVDAAAEIVARVVARLRE